MKYVVRGGFIVPENTPTGCPGQCEANPVNTYDIVYAGPNLPCTGGRTCEDLTTVLQKMDSKICELVMAIYNLTSTTTTMIPT